MAFIKLINTRSCRLGEPDQIAGVVSFLVSEDAGYITGETIAATGGMISRL